MKNLLSITCIICLTIISCSQDNSDLDLTNNSEALESRFCEADYHCTNFPAYNSVNTCDLDLTSFVFTANPGSNETGIRIVIVSSSGWSLGFDPSLGQTDSNVTFIDNNGQIIPDHYNQLIIECGAEVLYRIQIVTASGGGNVCTVTLVCDEECCTPSDCCDGTSISYNKVSSNEFCCTYDITVSNQEDCINTLWVGKTFHQDIAPFTTETITKEFCRSIQVSIVDEDNNICYKDLIDCTCCSLLDVNIESRGSNYNETCCLYTVWLTNLGECEISVNDKFGNPIITISPGETDSTYQKACDGKDNVYEVFVTNELGNLEACQLITLPGNCE